MYLNFNLILEKGFEPNQMVLLQAIKQNSTEDLSNLIPMLIQSDRDLEKLKEGGYIKLIKGKKGQSEFERLRIDSKGTKLLEDISTPEVTEGDLAMFTYLKDMYLSHEDEDRVVGNIKKTKIYCAILRNYLSLDLKKFYWLCYLYLEQEKYTKKLENIFLDSNKNRYGKLQNNVDDSPLYQYYIKNKSSIENFWKRKGL